MHTLMLPIVDSENYQQKTAKQFIAVHKDGYKLLLELSWLQKCNLTIK